MNCIELPLIDRVLFADQHNFKEFTKQFGLKAIALYNRDKEEDDEVLHFIYMHFMYMHEAYYSKLR